MNTKLTLSALLIAALPLAAQADDNATQRALKLNQQPIAAQSQQAPSVTFEAEQVNGDSQAMQEARAKQLSRSRSIETRFEVSGDELAPAKQATT
ncbi:hypothetical protein FIU88_10590 [Halomonas sp. THAF12]|uniref:hypothetical protein n=1 Tax=Halomonas sp. THAF12 TaxID=2587849 RepID=UPI0012698485|nr:hypothetical protein [Halomonas sp. THAF12]QFT85421.1 hypothetical protein FIU88_10590 [Halomonas sp. THAF12]